MAIDAHTVVAELILSASQPGSAHLASTDGKTWAALQTKPFQEVDGTTILAGRDRGLVFSDLGDGGPYALDDNLAPVALNQSGECREVRIWSLARRELLRRPTTELVSGSACRRLVDAGASMAAALCGEGISTA